MSAEGIRGTALAAARVLGLLHAAALGCSGDCGGTEVPGSGSSATSPTSAPVPADASSVDGASSARSGASPLPIRSIINKHSQCLVKRELIITEGPALEAFLAKACTDAGPSCKCPLALEEVNLAERSIMGTNVDADDCATVEVQVTDEPEEKRHRALIAVHGHGCRGVSSRDVWVIVPRLQPGYTVLFEQTHDGPW